MFKKKVQKLECEGISSGLLINLKPCVEYMKEMGELITKIDIEKIMKSADEESKKLIEENQPIMTRLSELVVLVEITKTLENK